MNQDEKELFQALKVLWNYDIVPALSCGMHAGLIQDINNKLQSKDWLANVGGALHSHPLGTRVGGQAIVEAINR